jgi:hypothetical protein
MTAPGPTSARVTLYWSAIWRAAITTVTFAVPLSLLQKWLVESGRLSKSDAVNFLLNFAIMFCGALGGYAAAKLVPNSRLQNGAAAAALGAIVIQVTGAIRHIIVGRDVSSPISWIFLALLLSIFGMFGAWVYGKSGPTNGVAR